VGVGLCNNLAFGCNIKPYVILDVSLNMLNFGHKWMPHCVVFGDGVMLAPFGAATKPRASCGTRHKAVLLGTRWYRGG
jgi:hypothetical protein